MKAKRRWAGIDNWYGWPTPWEVLVLYPQARQPFWALGTAAKQHAYGSKQATGSWKTTCIRVKTGIMEGSDTCSTVAQQTQDWEVSGRRRGNAGVEYSKAGAEERGPGEKRSAPDHLLFLCFTGTRLEGFCPHSTTERASAQTLGKHLHRFCTQAHKNSGLTVGREGMVRSYHG